MGKTTRVQSINNSLSISKSISRSNRQCIGYNCKTEPIFGPPHGGTLACSKHKPERHSPREMVEIDINGNIQIKKSDFIEWVDNKNKKCENENCFKRASFNYKDQTSRWCGRHRPDKQNMINVTHKSCKFESCTNIPHFAKITDITPIYCSKHKDADMVDIIHPRCIECKKNNIHVTAKYNYASKKGAKYCKYCKNSDMIDKYPDKRSNRSN